jgi:hypothetical protein
MDRTRQFLGQQAIDQPLSLDAAEADEACALQGDGEVALAAGGVPGMARVSIGIVHDLQTGGRKGVRELAPDRLGDGGHDFILQLAVCQFLN